MVRESSNTPPTQLNDIIQSMNREEKEIEHHMESYIAFMRTCKSVPHQSPHAVPPVTRRYPTPLHV
jgi:hypothetical protein